MFGAIPAAPHGPRPPPRGGGPVRQIIYQSALGPGVAAAEITRMVARASQRNRASRVTGRLVQAENRFVQLIEGEPAIIGPLYSAIAVDRRHGAVTTLADRRTSARAYGEWDLRSGAWPALRDTARDELEPILRQLDRTPAARRNVAFEPALQLGYLRVQPRQPRARATVQRLLEAGEALALRTGRLDRLTLEAVAEAAGLTPSTAYRYVPDLEALIRLGMRRRQDRMKRRFVLFMANRDFHDATELAEAAVDFTLAQTQAPWPLPPTILLKTLLPRYHQVDAQAIWAVAEAVHAGLAPGCACRAIGVTRLAAAFLSLGNVVRGMLLRDPAMLAQPETRALLLSLCLGALGGPALPGGLVVFGGVAPRRRS